jgi:hypothetical protein
MLPGTCESYSIDSTPTTPSPPLADDLHRDIGKCRAAHREPRKRPAMTLASLGLSNPQAGARNSGP